MYFEDDFKSCFNLSLLPFRTIHGICHRVEKAGVVRRNLKTHRFVRYSSPQTLRNSWEPWWAKPRVCVGGKALSTISLPCPKDNARAAAKSSSAMIQRGCSTPDIAKCKAVVAQRTGTRLCCIVFDKTRIVVLNAA